MLQVVISLILFFMVAIGTENVDNKLREYRLPEKECREKDVNEAKFKFSLYTRARPTKFEFGNNYNEDILTNSTFNISRPTKFLIQGWLQEPSSLMDLVNDFLLTHEVNIVTMDWSPFSKVCNIDSTKRSVVPVAAEQLASFLKGLIASGGNCTRFHLIGYGVAPHIVGMAVKKLTPRRVGRITALDPLGYGFNNQDESKLQSGDARFVDIIHTSLPVNGTVRDIGDISFYPNGGFHPQPGIINNDTLGSNWRSLLYFKKTLNAPFYFMAQKCNSWSEYQQNKCKSEEVEPMGELLSFRKRGRFYLYADLTNVTKAVNSQ